jgi:hypothetical protein
MTAKEKQIKERLEQIKQQAAGYALNPKQADLKSAFNLVEEAAGLGLDLLEVKK